jgi:hypothetical protein
MIKWAAPALIGPLSHSRALHMLLCSVWRQIFPTPRVTGSHSASRAEKLSRAPRHGLYLWLAFSCTMQEGIPRRACHIRPVASHPPCLPPYSGHRCWRSSSPHRWHESHPTFISLCTNHNILAVYDGSSSFSIACISTTWILTAGQLAAPIASHHPHFLFQMIFNWPDLSIFSPPN